MANNGFNNYQSGGSYNNPNRAIESGVQRHLTQNVAGGDVNNLGNMALDEFSNKTLEATNALVGFNNMTQAEQAKFKAHVENIITEADNFKQALKDIGAFTTKFISSHTASMKSYQATRGTDPNSKGAVGVINNNIGLQQTHLLQVIADRLGELDSSYDKGLKTQQVQEESLFDTLKQTIVHSIFNSPTVTKIGNLGASLMSAGLFKIASNEAAPAWLRQGAMGAVYMQLPQTITDVVGATLQTTLSVWLAQGGGKIIGSTLGNIARMAGGAMSGLLSNAGGLIMQALPVALPLILAGAGIFALIKGISNHKKNMKENDSKIDNDSSLTQGQKDRKKLGAHTASGAKTGAVSGALIGAAIGTLIAPGIGTAIGGAIGGGALGAGIGGLVGSIKPLGNMMKHGLMGLGNKIVAGAKWAQTKQDKIAGMIKPALDIIKTVLEAAFPFFTIMRMIFTKIANSTWFKALQKAQSVISALTGGQKDNSSTGTRISQDKSKGGRPTDGKYVDLRDANSMYGVNLKGALQGAGTAWGNSKPWTSKENLATFAYLDNTLANMGINAVYSSNMGGNHKGGAKSHANGDKVDVVGQSWTPEQYRDMYNRGFFGGKTGALGYEYKIGQTHVTTPEEYERLYKEKGGKMMGGNNHYDLTNKAGLVSVDANDVFYNEYNRINKAIKDEKNSQEKAVAETVKKDKSNAVQNILMPASKAVMGDVSSMDNYTKLNTTNSVLNVGGPK